MERGGLWRGLSPGAHLPITTRMSLNVTSEVTERPEQKRRVSYWAVAHSPCPLTLPGHPGPSCVSRQVHLQTLHLLQRLPPPLGASGAGVSGRGAVHSLLPLAWGGGHSASRHTVCSLPAPGAWGVRPGLPGERVGALMVPGMATLLTGPCRRASQGLCAEPPRPTGSAC